MSKTKETTSEVKLPKSLTYKGDENAEQFVQALNGAGCQSIARYSGPPMTIQWTNKDYQGVRLNLGEKVVLTENGYEFAKAKEAVQSKEPEKAPEPEPDSTSESSESGNSSEE